MVRYSNVTLISVNPAARGVGTDGFETRRIRDCEVKSVSQNEVYMAAGAGLNPELKLRLFYESDYQGENICEFEGQRYRILRTYIPETNGIELIIQSVTKNAARGD